MTLTAKLTCPFYQELLICRVHFLFLFFNVAAFPLTVWLLLLVISFAAFAYREDRAAPFLSPLEVSAQAQVT